MLSEVNEELYKLCEAAASEIIDGLINKQNAYFAKCPVPTSFPEEGRTYVDFLARRAAYSGIDGIGTVESRAKAFLKEQISGLSKAERFTLDAFYLEMNEEASREWDDPSPEVNRLNNTVPDTLTLADMVVEQWGDYLYDKGHDDKDTSRTDIVVTPLKLGEKCPCCGGKLLPIVYGEPGPELFEKADKGEVILGGCIVTGLDPQKECAECGFRFLEVNEKDLND